MKKTISIIIPIYNEEENIPYIYYALKEVWKQVPAYGYEYIFVNDGSCDTSARVIERYAKQDVCVKYVEFSRNFGKEMATSAGIEVSHGDAVIMIDADLQHPPELIPELIQKWENGAEIVVGVRTKNEGKGFIKSVGSWFFYRIMDMFSETTMKHGETDFRLIDRVVADAFLRFSERERMTRSLINWLGFRKELVMFASPARAHGTAKYSTQKLVHLALYSFVTNSLAPLRFAGYLGLGITLFSGALGLAVLVNKFMFGDPLGWNVSGSAQLTLINVFLVGIVLVVLGIISLYIGNINTEVTQRPLYVVRKRINL